MLTGSLKTNRICSENEATFYIRDCIFMLTFYVLNFSEGTKHIFIFYVTPPHWHVTVSWNPSSCKTRIYSFYIVNIMGSDVLATQGDKASAAMILPLLNRVTSVPARWGLTPVQYYGQNANACNGWGNIFTLTKRTCLIYIIFLMP